MGNENENRLQFSWENVFILVFRKLDYVHGVSNLNLFWAEIIENEYLGDRDIQLFYNREQDVLESLKRVFRVLGDLGVLIKHSSYLFNKKNHVDAPVHLRSVMVVKDGDVNISHERVALIPD